MRILLVLEACGGGAGRHVVDLARGLLSRGHDVSLCFSPVRADAWFQRDIDSLDGLVCHELPIGRSVSFGDILACTRLRHLIDRYGPYDILHGHSSKGGAVLRLAQIGRSIPVIYTPHAPITMDPELSRSGRIAYSLAERMLAGLCERIICVSPVERDHLLEIGFSEQKLRTVCNGIDTRSLTNREAVRCKLGLDDATVCFGFVGRISHQKAVDRAIRAFGLLSRQVDDARLVIIGDGPDLCQMKSLAVEIDTADRVTFLGAVQASEFMPAFDVFVLPSRYEAMPYVLLEAAASRLPIVMSDVGGAHLIVRNGVNGYVLPEMDTEKFSDRLVRLATQPELRQEMASRSAEIAAEFSLGNMVDGTLLVYEELLESQ